MLTTYNIISGAVIKERVQDRNGRKGTEGLTKGTEVSRLALGSHFNVRPVAVHNIQLECGRLFAQICQTQSAGRKAIPSWSFIEIGVGCCC